MSLAEICRAALVTLFTISWQSAVIVVLIRAVQRVLSKQLPPRWRYGLWSLLLLRLVLPWTPSSALSIYNLQGRSVNSGAVVRVHETDADGGTACRTPEESRPEVPTKAATPDGAYAGESVARERFTDLICIVLFYFWVGGALALAGYTLLINAQLSERMSRGRQVIDNSVLSLLERCKIELELPIPVHVIETPEVQTPALMGFIRPRLLLPKDFAAKFSPSELRYIFLHELGHVKRGDVAIDWVLAMVQALHWFNPVVWVTFARIRADREVACDALVLQVTGETSKQSYGQAIINLVERLCANREPAVAMVGILEDGRSIRNRILNITSFSASRSGHWKFGAVTLLVLGILALTDRAPVNTAVDAVAPAASVAPAVAVTEIREAMADVVAAKLRADRLRELEIQCAVEKQRRERDQIDLENESRRLNQLQSALERTNKQLQEAEARLKAQEALDTADGRFICILPPRPPVPQPGGKNNQAGNGNNNGRAADKGNAGNIGNGVNPPPGKALPPPNNQPKIPPNVPPVVPPNVPLVRREIPVPPAIGPMVPVAPVTLANGAAGLQAGDVPGLWRTDGQPEGDDDEVIRGTVFVQPVENAITLSVADRLIPKALQISRGNSYRLSAVEPLLSVIQTLARRNARVQVRGEYEDRVFNVHAVRELNAPDGDRSPRPMKSISIISTVRDE